MTAATLYRQLLQLVLWGGYFFLNLALASQWMPLTSGMVMIFVLLSVGLWVATELLRHWVISRGWLDLSGPALVLRLLLAVLLLPLLLHVLIFITVTLSMQLEWIRMPGDQADYRPMSALMYWFNTVVLMGLWSGCWVGVAALRRYRHGEIARLRSEAERSTRWITCSNRLRQSVWQVRWKNAASSSTANPWPTPALAPTTRCFCVTASVAGLSACAIFAV